MIDVKEVLRRWSAGQSDRKIARETGADRKTVARYIAVRASSSALARGRELTDDEVHEVAQCVQARPLPDAERRVASEVARAPRAHRALARGKKRAAAADARSTRCSCAITGSRRATTRSGASRMQELGVAQEGVDGARRRSAARARRRRSTSARWGCMLDADDGSHARALGAHRHARRSVATSSCGRRSCRRPRRCARDSTARGCSSAR